MPAIFTFLTASGARVGVVATVVDNDLVLPPGVNARPNAKLFGCVGEEVTRGESADGASTNACR